MRVTNVTQNVLRQVASHNIAVGRDGQRRLAVTAVHFRPFFICVAVNPSLMKHRINSAQQRRIVKLYRN